MITIEYSESGIAINDFQCHSWVENVIIPAVESGMDQTFSVSTQIAIDCVRAWICEGKLDHEKVQFQFRGLDLPISRRGRLWKWPTDFCKVWDGLLETLAMWGK